MKLLTYKIMPNISSWLRVTKKYNNMSLSNTWRATPKHTTTQHTRSQHGPLGLAWKYAETEFRLPAWT